MSAHVHEDFEDMLSALIEADAEFLVVGAYALAVHGLPRATGDIDIFVRPSEENAKRVYRALQTFGAPLESHGVSEADFERSGSVYQIGLPPRRIDILTSISGVSFDEAAKERVYGTLGEQKVPFIGSEPLIRNKRASGRARDLDDAERLERLRRD